MIVKEMTSRERVRAAIRREPVDRMPIDLGAHFSTGISAFAYHDLREHLGLSTANIQIPDPIQLLARVDEDILERFHIDTMVLFQGWPGDRRWNPRGKYEFSVPEKLNPTPYDGDGWELHYEGRHLRMPSGGYFFDGGYPSFDTRSEDDRIDAIAKEAERIAKETPYATMFQNIEAFFSNDADFLCDMLTDPDDIHEEQERRLKEWTPYLRKLLKAIGENCDIICFNSDIGMQSGPMCDPEKYAQLCAPYVKKLTDIIHEESDCKTFLHSCGAIRSLIPTFIDMGIDILNPVQITAADMDPTSLKKEFGKDICFWGGGCDTQNILDKATPEEVRENVLYLANALKGEQETSGFVFAQVHNVMGDVPVENIIALLDASYEASAY